LGNARNNFTPDSLIRCYCWQISCDAKCDVHADFFASSAFHCANDADQHSVELQYQEFQSGCHSQTYPLGRHDVSADYGGFQTGCYEVANSLTLHTLAEYVITVFRQDGVSPEIKPGRAIENKHQRS
jgi:hypothetical protein